MKKVLLLILIACYFYTGLFALDIHGIKQSCESKNYKLCSALGTIYYLGIDVDKNITKSIVYHMIACRGEIKYCNQFKKFLKNAKATNLNDKKIFYYSRLACDLNDSNSCFFVGNFLFDNKTNAENKGFMDYYEKSCKLGNARACYKVGINYYNKYAEKASIYLRKSCDGNFSSACFDLGVMNEKGLNIDKNHTNAILYYNKACTMNNIEACFNLALTYKENMKKRILFEKTCKSKKSLGCYDLANIYMLGQDIPIDYTKVRKLYQKSCHMNESKGCNNTGYLYQHGLGVDVDYIKARKYYKKACSMGNQQGCKNLKLLPLGETNKQKMDI